MTVPPPINEFTRPKPPITDGIHPVNGTISSSLLFQSSGVLRKGIHGEKGEDGEVVIDKRDGYTIELGGRDEHLDGKGRQRIELLSKDRAQAGERWIYKWKTHLPPLPPSPTPRQPNFRFTHLVQLLSRQEGHGGYIMALTLAGGTVHINTIFDKDQDETKRGEGIKCIKEEDFRGKTWYHRCVVVWGPNGSIEYTVQHFPKTGPPLAPPALSFKISDVEIPANGSLKTGIYRAFVPEGEEGPMRGWAGEFDFKKR